jgi:trigger factor
VRKDLEEQIKRGKENNLKRERKEEIVDILVSKHDFELPQKALAKEKEGAQGKNEAEIEKNMRARFILVRIAELENISVNDQDLTRFFMDLSRASGQDIGELVKFYRQENRLSHLSERLLVDKTLEFLLEQAKLRAS